jgi:hypothetical protein
MILNFVCILKAEKNADTWVLTPEILGGTPRIILEGRLGHESFRNILDESSVQPSIPRTIGLDPISGDESGLGEEYILDYKLL